MGLEDSLEKEMATYSSILAWEIPWPEEPGGLQLPITVRRTDVTDSGLFSFIVVKHDFSTGLY